MKETVRTIHCKCDPVLSKNNKLPNNSFIVEYILDGETYFDIVSSNKKVKVFDEYWDKYRSDLIRISSTEGRVNPRLWKEDEYRKQ